ncbi:flavodoxin domain-containing protein [Tessaracoccus sp. MC1679]|uniref:flavodoxin domain-containing protein n=1 Tax=unclassified Tessaracoccus TaxID=2635419 RepID=UPI0016007BFC|nr:MULTISPECIES: flavodoxin domain-containing protein [unclassified Tessaracoccus]MBB1512781.1 flavodoxin domain-containing protein [Tessaracoccus sp. MC1627]MBB1516347.1 flavodoxin domain-containing protein [Tessaracoccus sp. MC1679]
MKVLVAYATRHGSTAGIAERIAEVLTQEGLSAQAVPVESADPPENYDAVVLGGAAYMFHWLKPALQYAHRHRAALSTRSVWLFSSGPLGTEPVDAEGNDALAVARPREFDELTQSLSPRGERVFFGAFDPTHKPIGFGERVTRAMPAAQDLLPAGDFRDWDDIESWAKEIAEELRSGDHPPTAS